MIKQMFFRSKQSTAWLALVSVGLKNKKKYLLYLCHKKSELEIGGGGGDVHCFFCWKF
jgi:hypothetical protein